ncbi:MAG: TAXI family TRAP transporter solute-binding subunit [Hyphomicrobiales bacterium]|nr:TAXI family TRAP transporter solute-binding subunit [Hyphomicrobiales bacterium]
MSRRRLGVASLAAIFSACRAARGSAETFVSIGSGEMTAVYYAVAKAICRAIFSELREQGFWCSAETTPGSAYNVERIASGELEFGIVQSDVLFAAYNGIGRWDGKPQTELRSVLSLFPELVTVVARADANIHILADLAGKRISVGSLATGPRTTWSLISPSLDLKTPARLTELRQSETTSALCSGTIDASFFVVAHPSELVSSQLAACPSNFVAIRESVIDKLVSEYPFYARRFIPTELYHLPDNIPSVGPAATLAASTSSDPDMVAAIAKAIMKHIDELKRMQPVLANLDPDEMVAQTLTAPAPLHPVAAGIYRDLGLIK